MLLFGGLYIKISKKKRLLHGFLSEKDGMLYAMLDKYFFFVADY